MLRRAGLRDVGPAVVRVTMIALAMLVALAAWRWWPGARQAAPEFPTSPAAEKPQPASQVTETVEASATGLLVHVVGAVRHPGVYELAAGSRAIDAVQAAGGVLPDAVVEAVNMARGISDGEQILIPDEDSAASASAAPGQSAASGSGNSPAGTPQVDLNSADAAALDALPGVGPSTAAKIVADREANGPFKSVKDLCRVSGIGPKKFEQLESLVCVR